MSNKQILWTSKDAAKATSGKSTQEWLATGISIDTRSLEKGDLFIALQGPSLDGHDYITQAKKSGASVCMVHKITEDMPEDMVYLEVKDTMQALIDLGQFARARTKAKIIGVTGSVGKTGTKEMLSIALSPSGKTHVSQKSYNNHWGVPLTLALMPADSEFAVFEMGMNNKGELTELSKQVRPDIALITTIEPVHIGHFKSVDEIADAKAEIFTGMDKDGTAILNIDNPHYQRLQKAAVNSGLTNIISFGEDEEADAILLSCKLASDGSRAKASINGEKYRYKISIPGKHIVMNSLASLAAVNIAGGDLDQAIEAIKNSEPIEGRGNRISIEIEAGEEPITIIDESYNASPASMNAALTVLSMVEPKASGRRIAVLGDMLELGAKGADEHEKLANIALHAKTDLLFACGPLMEAMYNKLPELWQGGYAAKSTELSEIIINELKPGDVILVKGSLGSRMAYIVDAIEDIQKNKLKAKAN